VQGQCQLTDKLGLYHNINQLVPSLLRNVLFLSVQNRTPSEVVSIVEGSFFRHIEKCPKSVTSVTFRAMSHPNGKFDVFGYLSYNDYEFV
jgi:hypothetical protein